MRKRSANEMTAFCVPTKKLKKIREIGLRKEKGGGYIYIKKIIEWIGQPAKVPRDIILRGGGGKREGGNNPEFSDPLAALFLRHAAAAGRKRAKYLKFFYY